MEKCSGRTQVAWKRRQVRNEGRPMLLSARDTAGNDSAASTDEALAEEAQRKTQDRGKASSAENLR